MCPKNNDLTGYHIDNIVMVHKDINLMCNKFSVEKFYSLCKIVSENNDK